MVTSRVRLGVTLIALIGLGIVLAVSIMFSSYVITTVGRGDDVQETTEESFYRTTPLRENVDFQQVQGAL